MIFTRLARVVGASISPAALSLAMVSMGAVAVTATPAAAKEKPAKPAKADYSKGFIAVYKPLADSVQSDAFNAEMAKAQIPALLAAISTEDDRFAAGNLILNIGQKSNERPLQQQGIEMMLASGKAAPDQIGLLNFAVGQMAYVANDYGKAREYFLKAISAGHSADDAEAFVAETYFNEDRHAEGLTYLNERIAARKAAGQPIPEAWVKRGVAMAYNQKMKAESARWAALYASEFPSATSWGDAVAIILNTGGYDNPEILDLLRLARRTGSFRDDRMFLEYLDAADYRRLPAEVVAVIDEGLAKGLVTSSNTYVADIRKQAESRVAVDKRDLAVLLKDARAPGATINAVLAAGDTLLSMGKPGEAEEFYNKALGLAGVNTPLVLTRLGIAQFDQGKYAESKLTFAKVEGARQAIANLWAVYAGQKTAPAAAAAPVQ